MKKVYIEWVDACRTERYHKDIPTPIGQELGVQLTYSVGIVVEETKECLSLAVSLSESGWYIDIINIPVVAIKKIEVLNH